MKRGGLRWNEEAFAAFRGKRSRFAAGTINGQEADAATDPTPRAIAPDGPTGFPGGADAASKPTYKPLERDVLRGVLEALALHPAVAWAVRMNVGAFENAAGRHVRVGFVGCSDVIGQLRDGRFLAVEVKRPGGKLTEAQFAFLGRVINNGGVGFVAFEVADVMRYVPAIQPQTYGDNDKCEGRTIVV